MAQLAAQAKGLYYPNSESIVEVIHQACTPPVYPGVPLFETYSVEPNNSFQMILLNPPYDWEKGGHWKNRASGSRAIVSH